METSKAKTILLSAISPAAPGPLYRQIIDGIKREISRGRLVPGDELPSFRLLAEQLLVSVITVKRAYEELEREGIIFRRQGLGTFIAENADQANRSAKLDAAKQHFRQGVAEAKQAGLKDSEILRLLKQTLNLE